MHCDIHNVFGKSVMEATIRQAFSYILHIDKVVILVGKVVTFKSA